MRKIAVLILISFILLAIPVSTGDEVSGGLRESESPQVTTIANSVLSGDGAGDDGQALLTMTNKNTDLQVFLLNSYNSPDTHQNSIDFKPYNFPGWTLYQATFDMINITAEEERESIGVTSPIDSNFRIFEHDTLNSYYYEQLAQGFYNQSHDGRLHNYSLYYFSAGYVPALRGNAFTTLRSDYTNNTSNFTIPNFLEPQESGYSWKTVSSLDSNLSSGVVYYAIMDGRGLYEDAAEVYPIIVWGSDDSNLEFPTHRYSTEFSAWSNDLTHEAFLNYTYTPWNMTFNSPLLFKDPEIINLQANYTSLIGSTWNINSDPENLTSILLSANQSIQLNYNLTLYYKRTISTQTVWDVSVSGNPVDWNVTAAISYPPVAGESTRTVNVSIPRDWTVTGLYNSTNPGTDYGNYVQFSAFVICSTMTNGTWTLTNTGYNYITNVVGLPVDGVANIQDEYPIFMIIEDETNQPATTSSTDLLVWHQGARVNSSQEPVVSGTSQHYWDIDFNSSMNGVYLLEFTWSNGTEAGYRSKVIDVYNPTQLSTASMFIEAYADDAFSFTVNFSDTYNLTGLTDSEATVVYSYDGASNVSLQSQGNGVWITNPAISTIGDSPGIYNVTVYAEGGGYENRTLTIDVNLTYETAPLSWDWSDPDHNISFVQNTNLTVYYNRTNGLNVTGALVEATIGMQSWQLNWDSVSESYWIQFNGSDFTGLPDTFSLNISATLSGYEPQYNDTLELTVTEVPDASLSVTWNPSGLSMTYIEQLRVTATYTYLGIDIEETGSTLLLYFNGSSPVSLVYNGSFWNAEVDASIIDLGVWNVTLWADHNGYAAKQETVFLTVNEDTPQVTVSWPQSAASTTYDSLIDLSITFTDSIGTPVTDGSITAVYQGTPYQMNHTVNGVYTTELVPGFVKGVHEVVVTVVRHGYQTQVRNLNLTILATTTLNLFEPLTLVSSEYEFENFTFSVSFEDTGHNQTIDDSVVLLEIDETVYVLTESDGIHSIELLLDIAPGTYVIDITATADYSVQATLQLSLDVLTKSVVDIRLEEIVGVVEGVTLPIDITLWDNTTDTAIAGEDVFIEVEVIYTNGTSYTESNTVTTNAEGVASWAFQVPRGGDVRINRLRITAQFARQRDMWSAQRIATVDVTLSPVDAALIFITSDFGIMTILALLFLAVIAVGYNKKIKPKRAAKRMSLEEQLLAFQDLDALKHFMAVYRGRGTCVFYHPFGKERIQADLISGFISAVTTVYGEIKGDGVQGTLEEIQYHGLRLNSYSGKYVVGILIIEGEMSTLLRQRLQWFVEMFEYQYDEDLDGWVGVVDCFDTEWVVSNLHDAFNYYWVLPQRIVPRKKLKRKDKKYIEFLSENLDSRHEFAIEDVLRPFAKRFNMTKAEALDILLSMQERGLIRPISIGTVLQRQGLGLAGEDEEGITVDMIPGIGELAPEPEPPIEEPVEETREETIIEKPLEEASEVPLADETVPEPPPKHVEEHLEEGVSEELIETPVEEQPLDAEEEVAVKPEPEYVEEKFSIGKFVESPEPVTEEEEKGPSDEELFIADVEALLKKRDDPDQQEQFLEDVEALLKKENIEDDEEE